MGPALDLLRNNLAIQNRLGQRGRLLHHERPCDLPCALQGGNAVAHHHQLNGLVAAIGHLDQCSTAHAFGIVRAALVLDPVARLFHTAQLHDLVAG